MRSNHADAHKKSAVASDQKSSEFKDSGHAGDGLSKYGIQDIVVLSSLSECSNFIGHKYDSEIADSELNLS